MLQTFLTILSAGTSIFLIIFLAYREYKSGDSALKKSIQDDYKTRNEQLERRVNDLEEEHDGYAKQILQFQAIIGEKDKQLDRYEKIFANRNPDLTDVLKEIKQFMSNIYEQNKHQTGILEQRQHRDRLIDEASKQHKGEPMRAPVNPL